MIAAIIQARMSSTRLPGKTLTEIAGEPVLAHLVRRAKLIPRLERVIIATTTNTADAAILQFAEERELPVFVGSENDVLDRFYQTARKFEVSTIVRVTPDCPLMDPHVAGTVLAEYLRLQPEADYVSNVHPPTYPDGLDTEVFSFDALARAWSEAEKPSEREHVTPYMRNHPELFRLVNVQHDQDLSSLRWTVDEPADLEFARAVYSHFASPSFGMEDVLRLLRQHPELAELNRGIGRNEGYLKSLRADALSKQAEAK
jgi:spore coat polysaccharide biosynthesis protein SpsF (cytidylyltransferase family)